MPKILEFLEDQCQFDIEIFKDHFLAFDIFFWQLGVFHGPNSIEVAIGPFSFTKQYNYD